MAVKYNFWLSAINHNTHKFVGTRGSKHVKMYICRKWCRGLVHCTFFLFEVTFTATGETGFVIVVMVRVPERTSGTRTSGFRAYS